MPNLPIISETIPEGSCPTTYNQLAQLFASHFFAVQSTGTGKGWIFSAAKPTLDQAPDYGWWQLDDNGVPFRPYIFSQGLWLSQHPMLPGQCVWLFNDILDIASYDGGDGTAIGGVSPFTGAMWQYARKSGNLSNPDPTDDPIIAAQFPIVRGTLESTTVLSIGDDGGKEKIGLTKPEMPPHQHSVITGSNALIKNTWSSGASDPPSKITGGNDGMSDSQAQHVQDHNPFFIADTTGGDAEGNVVPHSNMPPYVVGILIQRTNRTHYAIPA